MLVYTLQHYVLFVFQKVLVLSPSLLDVFRGDGVWDFIFSENFFYFGPASAELSAEYCKHNEVLPWNHETDSGLNCSGSQVNTNETGVLQMEVISFVKYAATLEGSSHNLVGSSSYSCCTFCVADFHGIEISYFVLFH